LYNAVVDVSVIVALEPLIGAKLNGKTFIVYIAIKTYNISGNKRYYI
jgi:hypothetical protein